ncbi:hypothetical protein GY45DRAFT_1433333 [Cubamyces sp. BRFM 1775]|nr:hypothetical protein GY45DRAFT_1433333 [Cubamyces sp. BRFM 1775]
MRSFVILAVFAGITAVYAHPKRLHNRLVAVPAGLPRCSITCFKDNGVEDSCIENSGYSEEADQCICDALRETDIKSCIEDGCNFDDISRIIGYLRQNCRPLKGNVTSGSAPATDLVSDAGTGDGQFTGDLQGSMLGDGDGDLGGELGGSMDGNGAKDQLGGDLEGSMTGSDASGMLGSSLGGSMTGGMAGGP